jgi:hypothetical protein
MCLDDDYISSLPKYGGPSTPSTKPSSPASSQAGIGGAGLLLFAAVAIGGLYLYGRRK